MDLLRYYSIGAHPSNSLPLQGIHHAPFHALLYKDSRGRILASTRTSQYPLYINGAPHFGLVELKSADHLSIESQSIDWMQIFDIKPEERVEREVKAQDHISEQSGMRFQLVLIYLAVLIMFILLFIYI